MVIKSKVRKDLPALTDSAICETMLDACSEAIIYLDLEMKIRWVNEEAAHLLNSSREELVGCNCLELDSILPVCRDNSCHKAVELKSSQHEIVRSFDEFGGEFIWDYTVIPDTDESAKVIGLTIVNRDITSQVKTKYFAERAAYEWSTAMDASDDAIYLLDPQLRLLRANKVFYQMTGMSPEKALGRRVGKILHPRSEERHCPICLAQEEKRDEVITLEPDDPNNFTGLPLEIKVKVVRDEEGRVFSILMYLHDLSRQRQVEEELREKRNRLTLINSIQHLFLTYHDDRLYPEVLNFILKVIESHYGYFGFMDENDNMVCLSINIDKNRETEKKVIPRSKWEEYWGQSLSEKKSIYKNKKLTLPTSDNEFQNALFIPIVYKEKLVGQFALAERTREFSDADVKKIESVAGQIAPILLARLKEERLQKVREETERKLRRAKEEWEQSFNAIGDIVTIQDSNMNIIRANQATFDLLGLPKEEVIGKHCYELFCKDNEACHFCPWLRKDKRSGMQSGIITHEMFARTFYVSMAPVLDENGDLQYIVHTAKDITDQRRMEEELFQAHKMEAVGTLAGGIAHDFNNILTAIIGYSELALDEMPPGSDREKDIQSVLKAATRAKELVKQILTFSRKGQEFLRPLYPVPIVKEALKLLRATLPTTVGLREEIDLDVGNIIANPTNIHQVLVNLCTNALHAMEKEQGTLTVKLRRVDITDSEAAFVPDMPKGPFIEIMVRDTGRGMDKETLEHIFEPYFTTKEMGKGVGMGLSLVHGIVRGSGGFIRVESKLGKGSTFHVYFPRLEEDEKIEIQERKPLSKSGGNERILIIDDEEMIASMYKTALEQLGYKATVNTSSVEAFNNFRSSPEGFDLIITDQTMPNLAGVDLARKILEVKPDFPIILCTGFSTMVSEELAKEIGIAKFLMKPFSIQTLTESVREVLDKKQGKITK